MEIYLLRHAQTAWNLESRLQGWSDSPLTEEGRRKAEEMARRLKDLKFDWAYSSDLGRARASLAPFLVGRELPVSYTSDLRELSLGPWEGRLYEEVCQREPEKFRIYFNDPAAHRVEGAETYGDLQLRIRRFLGQLKESSHQRVLIMAHGVSVQGILNEIQGKELASFWEEPLVEGMEITLLEYENGVFSLKKRAQPLKGPSY
ncbi:MAG: histidine phosphatase family protein [Tissierellia bacterium]|nr:histidine phosphatase family protein [Tissierellia bacterium]